MVDRFLVRHSLVCRHRHRRGANAQGTLCVHFRLSSAALSRRARRIIQEESAWSAAYLYARRLADRSDVAVKRSRCGESCASFGGGRLGQRRRIGDCGGRHRARAQRAHGQSQGKASRRPQGQKGGNQPVRLPLRCLAARCLGILQTATESGRRRCSDGRSRWTHGRADVRGGGRRYSERRSSVPSRKIRLSSFDRSTQAALDLLHPGHRCQQRLLARATFHGEAFFESLYRRHKDF